MLKKVRKMGIFFFYRYLTGGVWNFFIEGE